jgi:hypothetical protein
MQVSVVGINEKYDPIVAIMRSEDKSRFTDDRWKMLRPLFWEIDYFAFLILMEEFKDEDAFRYYRDNLPRILEAIMRNYATADDREDLRDQYPNFNTLVNEWNINVPYEER